MRWIARVVLAFLLVAGSVGQTPPAPQLSSFAGTFKAEFHKQTWLVLTLLADGAKLSGTLTHSAQLSADDEGDITSVSDDMSIESIVNTELDGDSMRITARDEEGNEARYALTLTGADTAELKSLVGEDDSGPKPFKLKRTVSSAK